MLDNALFFGALGLLVPLLTAVVLLIRFCREEDRKQKEALYRLITHTENEVQSRLRKLPHTRGPYPEDTVYVILSEHMRGMKSSALQQSSFLNSADKLTVYQAVRYWKQNGIGTSVEAYTCDGRFWPAYDTERRRWIWNPPTAQEIAMAQNEIGALAAERQSAK